MTTRSQLCALVAIILGFAFTSLARARVGDRANPSVRYTVRTDAALTRLYAHVCFDGDPPRVLAPGLSEAGAALLGASDDEGRSLPIHEGRIDTSTLGPGSCVRYRLDLDIARRSSSLSARFGSDITCSQGAWLWRDPAHAPESATVRFEFPAEIRAATPWPRRGGVHYLNRTAFQEPAFTAFGRFDPVVVERDGARIEAVRLGDGWDIDDAGIERWLSVAADGLASVQGHFPVDHVLVLMAPAAGRGIDFGMVRRGGGASVGLFVGQRSSSADLIDSWVTWHELAHLHLPALPPRDAWLFEGFATYYQEVLPARAGLHTPERAWRALLDGFARGARSGRADVSLADAAESMGQSRAYTQVYWSGAAFALMADVAAREAGGSLDIAIARAARRFRERPRAWTGRALCVALDRALGRPSIAPIYDEFTVRQGFPDVAPLLRSLGIRETGEHVQFRDAPRAAIRDAIMNSSE